jgi:GDPmannose 4,6-dehydratase
MRMYFAGSSETFGDTPADGADEGTQFQPKSPYGVAKAAAYWQVKSYRESYGLFAATGILFNHESRMRPARFVTRKIIDGVRRIAAGDRRKLQLGDLSIIRDWGHAPEYVDAMWRILQQEVAEDFVIATGQAHALQDFVALAFAKVGLDWRDWVTSDPSLRRPNEIQFSLGKPAHAHEALQWSARCHLPELIDQLMASPQET